MSIERQADMLGSAFYFPSVRLRKPFIVCPVQIWVERLAAQFDVSKKSMEIPFERKFN